MQAIMGALVPLLATGAAALGSLPQAAAHDCRRTFTASMFRRAAITAYAGTRRPDRRDRAALERYARCSRPRSARRVDLAVWARSRRENAARRSLAAHPWLYATASWYDDAGATACGFHAGLGVANLSLPCGTRVSMCATACTTVVVQDRGPYVAGRLWDLNPAAKAVLGCGDLCEVRYRLR